jgi:class 3 adenylate cyclase/tetratricopeptide (TPR) repeat protein
MTVVCGNCGTENAAEAKFCNQCGNALDSSRSEAERRQITVFFSDLSGFTALSEKLDPEDVQGIMNRVFSHATRIVQKYGGRIDKFQGDAVMAVFGDPVVHEDDAERAVRSVLELHSAVDEMSPEVESRTGRPISMHTGINSGLVVTGAEFDNAVGDAINVASRLEDLSEPGEILLGPETAHMVAGKFDTEDHGTHELKGKSGQVPVTKVLGYASARIEPSRRQAQFVGRHEELGVLLDAVERMRDGESSVITVKAEAGAGKTRLLAEFRGRLPDEVQWLEGRAYAYGENIPYAAVTDLLSRAMGINEDDSVGEVEAKLRSAVAGLADNVEQVYAPLARLFGLMVPKGAALDRETYQSRLLDSVVEMAEAMCRQAPTVLALQDLHWADSSTVQLIKGLIGRIETPVVLVANYRPEFTLEAPSARELGLRDLSNRQTGELLASLLDDQSPPPAFVDFICERTDGNPFFIEEIVNSLIETGTLQDAGEGWALTGPLDEIDLPTSIRGVIGARIDRLDEHRRRVLREASVVGRDFLYDIVRRVASDAGDLMPSLSALEAADLIREKAIDPDLEYYFKHALTQDVAYDGLLKSEREELHARTAAAIEAQFAGRLEEVTETLAFHWLHSGVVEKAVPTLMAAGRKAMERFALAESQAHYQHAHDLLDSQPESEERDRAIVELLLEWAFLAYYQAQLYELRKLLIEHQDAVDRVGDEEQKGMWVAWIGHATFAADGEHRRANEILDRALAMGRKADNHRVIGYTQCWRTFTLWWLGRIDEGLEAGREAVELSEQLPDEPYVWFKAQLGLGYILSMSGDMGEALRIADELIDLGRRIGSARSESMGYIIRANVYAYTDPLTAIESAETATEIANDPIYQIAPAPSVLFSMLMAGETEEARRYKDEKQQRFAAGLHVHMSAAWFEMIEGLLLIQEGELAAGFGMLERLIEASEARGEFLLGHYAEMLLADSYARLAMADNSLGVALKNPAFVLRRGLRAGAEARRRLDTVLSSMDEWHLGSARSLLELTYAQLLAHEGDREGAIDHLQRSMAALEPLGDTELMRQARALMTQLEGDA